jgi:UDP-N-acetylmuramate dehydrogenase
VLELLEDEPLAPRTTLGIGGRAKLFATVHDEAELREAASAARARGLPLFVLGGGSNLLVSDRGLDALVVRLRITSFDVDETPDGVRFAVGAGYAWDEVVARAVAAGCAGLECLSGIPGDTGATPIQNVGAYGQEVSETIAAVEALELATGEAVRLEPEACAFGYRMSAFKRAMRGLFVVTRVHFRLRPGGPAKVAYPELARALGEATPSLAHVRDTVIRLRRAKSMVLDASDENAKSAGSFFTNPIVDSDVAERARDAARAMGQGGMPEFAAGEGKTKLSAAWLIERAGFARGTTRGRVGISTKHSLALVNKGGASASELVAFALEVQQGVADHFGVRITPEPELVGFDPGEIASLVATT